MIQCDCCESDFEARFVETVGPFHVCRGCYAVHFDGDEEPEFSDGYTDVEADADTLASAGWGTDEDYGYFGGNDDFGYGEGW